MIRRRIMGPIYTADVSLRRDKKSWEGLEHFSTYDRYTDSFAWRPFEDLWYIVVPARRQENTVAITLYLELPKVMKDNIIRGHIEKILNDDFLKEFSGIEISSIGHATLVVCPAEPESGWEDETEFRPESFSDMIIHG